MLLVVFSLALLFISRLGSQSALSRVVHEDDSGASAEEVGHSSAVFFWESPCMCIYITFAVSHDALWGEFEKLVCVFLWASRSASLMVNEHW